MELRALAGRRIRCTSTLSGRRSIGRIRAVSENSLTVDSEFVDAKDAFGQVIVEILLPEYLLILAGDSMILRHGLCQIEVSNSVSALPAPTMEFLRMPAQVEFKLPCGASASASLVAAGHRCFALESSNSIPLGKYIEFNINDEGRQFTISGPVSNSIDRGRSRLYFVSFDDVPRVISLFWQKLQNTG
ncbi:hypothetical protein QPK87_30805 [Kamptonema cortianum]|nr:hypothetical protein [Geitlerinema splendidum]MDK3160915.1 hypothetical protein [Kamptonema cortianum]